MGGQRVNHYSNHASAAARLFVVNFLPVSEDQVARESGIRVGARAYSISVADEKLLCTGLLFAVRLQAAQFGDPGTPNHTQLEAARIRELDVESSTI